MATPKKRQKGVKAKETAFEKHEDWIVMLAAGHSRLSAEVVALKAAVGDLEERIADVERALWSKEQNVAQPLTVTWSR